MKKLTFILTGLFIILTSGNPIRVHEVTGVVTDENGFNLSGASVVVKGSTKGAITDLDGRYRISIPGEESILKFSFVGYISEEVKVGEKTIIDVSLKIDAQQLEEVIVVGYGSVLKRSLTGTASGVSISKRRSKKNNRQLYHSPFLEYNMESYSGVSENTFQNPFEEPLSTFSIDVDAASYSNVRRFINAGSLPPKDAVRIEEMINYFNYDYEEPEGEVPFSIHMEVASAPWNKSHHLVHIGLQGKRTDIEDLPPSNLVFLLDVSGSMDQFNKLPLLKKSFKMLVQQMRPQDQVSIVVYAGAAGLVLPPTSGNNKEKIYCALNQLQAGGSTAGGAGLDLAYKIAKNNLVDGNNRVIIATDGDFNVGESSNQSMEKLIEQKRKDGVYLTVLGFGMGNYKDSKMEILADKGNGNYAYIDNILEAQKVLVKEFGGTLHTIAKDVKLQVEFNPAKVQAYRLIGYENRVLEAEDFNDDKKDAGELGVGHSVTALYEIIPVGVESSDFRKVDKLKYQNTIQPIDVPLGNSNDVLTVKFRYKSPNGGSSKLIVESIEDTGNKEYVISQNLQWSSAVVQFGMILTDSPYKGDSNFDNVLKSARNSKGPDADGYRQEFIKLVKSTKLLHELE